MKDFLVKRGLNIIKVSQGSDSAPVRITAMKDGVAEVIGMTLSDSAIMTLAINLLGRVERRARHQGDSNPEVVG